MSSDQEKWRALDKIVSLLHDNVNVGTFFFDDIQSNLDTLYAMSRPDISDLEKCVLEGCRKFVRECQSKEWAFEIENFQTTFYAMAYIGVIDTDVYPHQCELTVKIRPKFRFGAFRGTFSNEYSTDFATIVIVSKDENFQNFRFLIKPFDHGEIIHKPEQEHAYFERFVPASHQTLDECVESINIKLKSELQRWIENGYTGNNPNIERSLRKLPKPQNTREYLPPDFTLEEAQLYLQDKFPEELLQSTRNKFQLIAQIGMNDDDIMKNIIEFKINIRQINLVGSLRPRTDDRIYYQSLQILKDTLNTNLETFLNLAGDRSLPANITFTEAEDALVGKFDQKLLSEAMRLHRVQGIILDKDLIHTINQLKSTIEGYSKVLSEFKGEQLWNLVVIMEHLKLDLFTMCEWARMRNLHIPS